MLYFKAKLRMSGSYISKLQSDTIFGGLCWAYTMLSGNRTFAELRSRCLESRPPFVVSDAFPGDLLPRPFIPDSKTAVPCERTKRERLDDLAAAKSLKDAIWLDPEEFKQTLAGTIPDTQPKAESFNTIVTLHNTINRNTGITLDEGGLYELTETFAACEYLSLYLKVDEDWTESLCEALTLLSKMGVGRKRSLGKGGFDVLEVKPWKAFEPTGDEDAFVSLSHFVPARGDPVGGYYRTIVKYPRLDREFALNNNPLKYPIVLLTPGSSFFVGDQPAEYYGSVVTEVAPAVPEAFQSCYCLPIPFRWVNYQ